ncbi:hypothetical protein, partial [Tardiphaga sp.]|uniref:hypothetical protein n=1 Tax=Tardiphaga sp. TaxID=1926292 RepID=UPI002606DFA3
MNSDEHQQLQIVDDDVGEDEREDGEQPQVRLRAAIAWVGTRDTEFTHLIEMDDWDVKKHDQRSNLTDNGSEAWAQLKPFLVKGAVVAKGIRYTVPESFDLNDGAWS